MTAVASNPLLAAMLMSFPPGIERTAFVEGLRQYAEHRGSQFRQFADATTDPKKLEALSLMAASNGRLIQFCEQRLGGP